MSEIFLQADFLGNIFPGRILRLEFFRQVFFGQVRIVTAPGDELKMDEAEEARWGWRRCRNKSVYRMLRVLLLLLLLQGIDELRYIQPAK